MKTLVALPLTLLAAGTPAAAVTFTSTAPGVGLAASAAAIEDDPFDLNEEVNTFFQRLSIPAGTSERAFDSFTVGLSDREESGRPNGAGGILARGFLFTVDPGTDDITIVSDLPAPVLVDTTGNGDRDAFTFTPRSGGELITLSEGQDFGFLVSLAGLTQVGGDPGVDDRLTFELSPNEVGEEDIFGDAGLLRLSAADLAPGASYGLSGSRLSGVFAGDLVVATSFVLVPEPASALAAAAGGLLLLRRRRA